MLAQPLLNATRRAIYPSFLLLLHDMASASGINICCWDKLLSLLEVMLCTSKFVFQYRSLWPELSSGFVVEGAELQVVHWSMDARFECAIRDV